MKRPPITLPTRRIYRPAWAPLGYRCMAGRF